MLWVSRSSRIRIWTRSSCCNVPRTVQQLDLVHMRMREDRETHNIAKLCDRVAECTTAQKCLRLFDVAGLARRKEITVVGGVDVNARWNVCHHPRLLSALAYIGELLTQPLNLLGSGRGVRLLAAALVVRGLEDVL